MLKKSMAPDNWKSTVVPLQLAGILLAGILVLFFRNPDPLLNPIMYTEDGQWIGLALSKGWLYTLINAKDGYFVWGNLLLLWASEKSSTFLCGNSIICLPQAITLFSYAFFSFIAVLAWYTTRNVLPLFCRFLLFFLLLLMPLGDSSNEIIGRLSNIGYLFVFLTVLLLFLRNERCSASKYFVDVLLIICIGTNPVCIVLIFFFFAVQFALRDPAISFKVWLTDKKILLLGFVIIIPVFVLRMLNLQSSSVTGVLQLRSLIEITLARAVLYPFVFTKYQSLTDSVVLISTILLVTFGLLMYRLTPCKDTKRLAVLSTFALVLFLVTTLVMRQSLTQQLSGYRTTFPDRYFMGMNYLVLFIFVVLAGNLLRQTGYQKLIGGGVLALILLLFVLNIQWLLEFPTPRMNIASGPSFRDEICLSGFAVSNNHKGLVNLPIYFKGWSMQVPNEVVQDCIKRIDCSNIWQSFFISDENWEHGVAKKWAGFFVPNRLTNSDIFKVGSKVRFLDGEVREILRQDQVGHYLNIFLDGQPLDTERIGFPDKLEVVE